MNSRYQPLKRRFIRTKLYQSYKDFFDVKHAVFVRSKSEWLLMFRDLFNITTLVETGTYLGETLMKVQNEFDDIYSIELNSDFASEAKKHFRNKGNIKKKHNNYGNQNE